MKKAALLTAMTLVAGLTAAAGHAAPPAAPAAAPDPVSADPQDTSATYGNWTLHCQRSPQGAPTARSCGVIQSLQQPGQQGVIAQIIIGRATPKDAMHISIVLPTNVSFPSTVKAATDEKDAPTVDLSWQRCLPNGCIAESELKEDILKRWKTQSEGGHIQFKDGVGRDLAITFSFKGFAQALEGLAKSGS